MELIMTTFRISRDGAYCLQEDVSFYLRVKVQLQDDVPFYLKGQFLLFDNTLSSEATILRELWVMIKRE